MGSIYHVVVGSSLFCLAYQFVSATMLSIISVVKKCWNMSKGELEMDTAGPTDWIKASREWSLWESKGRFQVCVCVCVCVCV